MEKDSILEMLSYSLKAFQAIKTRDVPQAKVNAFHSLQKGPYFFNNYLLYLAYTIEDKPDSAHIYKTKALRIGSHGNNPYIYDNLIINMENDMKK